MLRIHFTGTDLAHIHVAEGPDPLWECVFSLQMLRARYARLSFADWRRRVRLDLSRHGRTDDARRLAPLVPDTGYFPDFLTPPEGLLGLEPGIEAVVATPPSRVGHELGLLHERSGAPAWSRELAGRSPRAREGLGRMLAGFHARALAPYWPAIRRRAEFDHSGRLRDLRTGGVERLLDGFRPAMRWRRPVLEVPTYPVDRDLYLRGRGLLLVPSHFCWVHPVAFADEELPPTLLYPLDRDPQWMCPWPHPRPEPAADPLARLLGRTRAEVLRVVSTVPNTGEVARRTGITPTAASQHTAVLREAGLITSHRHANSVFHRLTGVGSRLLRHTEAR